MPNDSKDSELRKSVADACRKYAVAAKALAEAHLDAAKAWETGDFVKVQEAQILSDCCLSDMNHCADLSIMSKRAWTLNRPTRNPPYTESFKHPNHPEAKAENI